MTKVTHYTVDVDAVTGEWIHDTLTEAGTVDVKAHLATPDTSTTLHELFVMDDGRDEDAAVTVTFV